MVGKAFKTNGTYTFSAKNHFKLYLNYFIELLFASDEPCVSNAKRRKMGSIIDNASTQPSNMLLY